MRILLLLRKDLRILRGGRVVHSTAEEVFG